MAFRPSREVGLAKGNPGDRECVDRIGLAALPPALAGDGHGYFQHVSIMPTHHEFTLSENSIGRKKPTGRVPALLEER